MGLKVNCGEELEASIKIAETRTRRMVVVVVLCLGASFLVGAAIYSLIVNNFSYVAGVWGVLAPIYGAIAGYYFGGRQESQ